MARWHQSFSSPSVSYTHLSRITTALLAIGISASMVFQTPVFATEETAVAVSSGVTTNGISGWPQGHEITSASAVIMEDTSDTILYAKDMDTTLSPAGAVKIMTCLLALENSQLDDQVTMTETGVSGVTDGGAHISSQLGEVFTMEQCLYALMLALSLIHILAFQCLTGNGM